MSETNSQVSRVQTTLRESRNRIVDLEAALAGKLEEQSSDANIRDQELTKYREKVASLETNLEQQNKAKTGLENELKITVSLSRCCFVATKNV